MLNELAQDIHQWAKRQGFWDNPASFPEQLALIHSEVSEALEEYRDNAIIQNIYYSDMWDYNKEKPLGIPTELADVIIRVLDTCAGYGIDIDEAIKIKMAYNRTRPHMNGGKKL